MHVLTHRGVQIAAAHRFQRLCMELAGKPADEQDDMHIEAGIPDTGVEVLR